MTFIRFARSARVTGLALIAFAGLGAAAGSFAAPMDPELRDELHRALFVAGPPDDLARPFSLVIRGGISLGVYESGVNWGLLRLMKDLRDSADASSIVNPELLAAAGASAGAINGFLAGLMWCSESTGDDRLDTLESNLLRGTWHSVDINELLA